MTIIPEKCPLCHCADQSRLRIETDKIFGDDGRHNRGFYHCSSCDVFFQWPRLSQEEEAQFYRNEFERFMEKRNSLGGMDWSGPRRHILSNYDQRRRRERYLLPYYSDAAGKPKASLLEVGCSSGFMLAGIAEMYGIECVGIEPSGMFREYLLQSGFRVTSSLEDLKSTSPGLRFDLITNFFVLEHIQEPVAFIKSLVDLLKPGGTLIMEIPNAMDALRTLYPSTEFREFYWSIAHPWYFTPASLDFLLREKCGIRNYRIVEDQRYDLGNHVQWLLDGRPGGQGRFADVFDAVFIDHFKKCLVSSHHSDTLVAFVDAPNAK